MVRPLGTVARTKAEHLLYAHWKPPAVANETKCGRATAYRWNQRIQMYRTIDIPYAQSAGRPRRITTAAKEWLLEYHARRPWAYQDELAIALEEEWGIMVSQPTICRVLKDSKISRKKGQRVGQKRNLELRVE
ncbi:hypothetical protein IMSHALPRED_004478 [Imshaugia aleurites]|uniref:Uncharacterized protein n=1 Tax=Imshaugia aleurites TaxID=172621 RepID=A0A8H3J8L9_9LECA|nr:hypothetical protein IMSHALPRED_004478 [Imshaugia aleurites]